MQAYTPTDQRLHHLAQVIAKANRSYVPKQEDDSHTNLYYDSVGDRIVGRWISTPQGDGLLALQLSTLEFLWLDRSLKVRFKVSSVGKDRAEVETLIAEQLSGLDLDPRGFADDLHFEIPEYTWAEEQIQAIAAKHLDEWRYYRSMANELCHLALAYLQLEQEVRIWPHHFDTGIYAPVSEKLGLGCGLAMEDSLSACAYFYVAGYPLKGSINYNALPPLKAGRWVISEHWKGAILPIKEVGENPQVSLGTFLQGAIDGYIKL